MYPSTVKALARRIQSGELSAEHPCRIGNVLWEIRIYSWDSNIFGRAISYTRPKVCGFKYGYYYCGEADIDEIARYAGVDLSEQIAAADAALRKKERRKWKFSREEMSYILNPEE